MASAARPGRSAGGPRKDAERSASSVPASVLGSQVRELIAAAAVAWNDMTDGCPVSLCKWESTAGTDVGVIKHSASVTSGERRGQALVAGAWCGASLGHVLVCWTRARRFR